MKILLLEPYYSGSHRIWAEGYQKYSKNTIDILSLPGRHWKWRMHGGAVSLAEEFMRSSFQPDLILATDMLDLSVFLSLCRKKTEGIPIALYFHENQLTYPWSPEDPDPRLARDNHYAFINYTSALSADAVFFNSSYHRTSFLQALPGFLRQFPDHQEAHLISVIEQKSQVLPLGMDLRRLDEGKVKIEKRTAALILWNHRWEYDKNPELFFKTLFRLKEEGISFELVVLGDSYAKVPATFKRAEIELVDRILHFGYADHQADYARWLWQADILAVTSNQDFFGGSVVEAIYCECLPILPQRLAYPEHLEEEQSTKYLYQTDAAFYTQLKSAILSVKNIRQQKHQADFVARYDWSTLAAHYDEIFHSI